MQVDRQTLRRTQRHIPVIQVPQIRLDILAPHVQVMPLMLLVHRAHVPYRHEEDIDEHRQNRRHDDVENSRGKAHVTDTAVTNQTDDTDQNDQDEQHKA